MSEIEDLIQSWDGEHVVVRHDPDAGAWIFIAAHSSKLGRPPPHPPQNAPLRVDGIPVTGHGDAA